MSVSIDPTCLRCVQPVRRSVRVHGKNGVAVFLKSKDAQALSAAAAGRFCHELIIYSWAENSVENAL